MKTNSDEARISPFLRYPGSKRRMLNFLSRYLPDRHEIKGHFIEPFVGGGAIYFRLCPQSAILADINRELIDLYSGIRRNPDKVWRIYREFPGTKRSYNRERDRDCGEFDLARRAARSLYLNRTCFKGMWRHNLNGKFNVGYGGQSRRWAIARKDIFTVSRLLKHAKLLCCDFEETISLAGTQDYLFVDPPYRPGAREQLHAHYFGRQFSFQDHKRLSSCLKHAHYRGVRWSLTISSHPRILGLYRSFVLTKIPRGTGRKIGELANNSGEVLVTNS